MNSKTYAEMTEGKLVAEQDFNILKDKINLILELNASEADAVAVHLAMATGILMKMKLQANKEGLQQRAKEDFHNLGQMMEEVFYALSL